MKRLFLLLVLAANFTSVGIAIAQPESIKKERGGMNNFDFLTGKWTITHRRLENPFQPKPDWSTFETAYEAWSLLGGLASMDKVYGELKGEYFEGVSVRTYDKDKNEWTIYWMDVWNSTLREQVRGSFENGVGVFYGEEKHKGVTYPMRFLWKDISESRAAFTGSSLRTSSTGTGLSLGVLGAGWMTTNRWHR
jgi:hypothetical protein